jgi:hypothetical protein
MRPGKFQSRQRTVSRQGSRVGNSQGIGYATCRLLTPLGLCSSQTGLGAEKPPPPARSGAARACSWHSASFKESGELFALRIKERRSSAVAVRTRGLPNAKPYTFRQLREWCLSIDGFQTPRQRDPAGLLVGSTLHSGKRRASAEHTGTVSQVLHLTLSFLEAYGPTLQ